ncbi:MAG: Rpp14/Pop5 family protein [Promethearchaeota archaeon]
MHLQRQRYVLFEYIVENPEVRITEKDVIRVIWKTLIKLFGEYSAYKTGLWMIEFDPSQKCGIIRCNNITKDRIIATIAFISSIKETPVVFHSIKTSGTIKKLKEIQKQFFDKHR